MKRKWFWIVGLIVIIAGLACLVIFAKPGWRVLLYDFGNGSIDTEIASSGTLTITFGVNGAQPESIWEKPGTEFIVKDSLTIKGVKYAAGKRLIVAANGELIEEEFLQKIFHDIIYTAWKLRHPDKYEKKGMYIRALEAELRTSPNDNPWDSLVLKFGTKVVAVDEAGDWVKIVSENPKVRGWIHKYVITESGDQLDILKKQIGIPKLMLLFYVDKDGNIQGKTLAGHMTVHYNEQGKTEMKFSPFDCLIFDKESLGKIPKPFELTGGYTIENPQADIIFMMDSSNVYKKFKISSFEKL